MLYGIRKFAWLWLMVLLATPAASIELQGIGGSLGWTGVSGDVGNTYLIRLHADLGPMAPGLHLVPDISRWSWSRTELQEETVRTSYFLAANCRYYVRSTRIETVKPYIGGGLGLHSLTLKSIQGTWTSSSRDFDIGLNLQAGATYILTPKIRLCGEARYTLVRAYSHLSVTAGGTFLIYR